MKNIILFMLVASLSCKAQQVYSLRPVEVDLPENSYEKDTNNELQNYEGTWKGTWGNKSIVITLKKITHKYDADFKRYRDYLVGKFKVLDSNNNILYDNSNLSDDNAKIKGVSFRRYGDKYSLIYVDPDLCNITGGIAINFTDSTKTRLNWKLNKGRNMITTDCQYYNTTPFPQALPEEIILTKQ
ncbi:hypothetical protein OK18_06820 [Chryseobacterium gallinarum]|uniref:DUF6705 domain-containing protein n=1 Tax=Chryseobacterium gallinarum TaxID=1324352 RepID=A0A0G3M0F4_CHRGL|nr:DUF6705 family protein [Chryseobacterium gallinarum]AKK72384.1 hypothetical protein OK18_06820 [Chryseobacterium gallinarum]